MILITTFYYLLLEYLLIVSNYLKTPFLFQPPKDWRRGKKGNVILIWGLWESWIFMKTIGEYLNKLGYRIIIVTDLKFNYFSISKSVEILANFVKSNNIKNTVLVSHSKGGIIGKLFMDTRLGKERVIKAISIATPYQGSIFGYLSIFSVGELSPNSRIIKRVWKLEKAIPRY